MANNPFDAAIFVSIRAHTKMGGPVVLQMLPTTPIGCCARFVARPRARTRAPLTQEQVETHVLMMLAMLAQCHTIRRELRNGLRDEHGGHPGAARLDERRVHRHVRGPRWQSKLLDDLRANLNGVRARCIGMYTSLWSVDRRIPRLGRVHAPWMDVYQTARQNTDAWPRRPTFGTSAPSRTVSWSAPSARTPCPSLRQAKRAATTPPPEEGGE